MQNTKMVTKTVRLGLALVTSALVLSACGGPETPPEPEPDLNAATETCALPARPAGEQPGVMCGQLSGVTATQVKPMQQVIQNPKEDVIATVTNNQFNQQLPSVASVNNEYASGTEPDPIAFNDLFVCTEFNSTSSTGTAGLKIIPINTLQANSSPPQELEVATASANAVTFTYWWFASKDENVTVSGKECGTYGTFSNQVFALKKGWNMVKFTLTTTLMNTTFSATAPTATRFTWRPAGTTAPGMIAQAQKREPYFHMPWLTLDKYKNRR